MCFLYCSQAPVDGWRNILHFKKIQTDYYKSVEILRPQSKLSYTFVTSSAQNELSRQQSQCYIHDAKVVKRDDLPLSEQ